MENYITKEGDTIVSVAQLFGIRIIDLIETNNLENVYNLEPGLELIIPTDRPLGFTYYTVQKGDNLYQIARKYGLDLQTLSEINGLEIGEYIFPGQKITVPKEGVSVYITKEGDSLKSFYERINLPAEEVEILNQQIYLLPEQLIAYRRRNI